MGFGLLFIGYSFLVTVPLSGLEIIDTLTNIVGFVIMIIALHKLVNHGENFRRARLVLYYLAIWGVGIAGMEVATMLNWDFAESLIFGMRTVHFAALAALHFFLLMGMHRLAIDVDIAKIARKTKRNMYLSVGFIALQAALELLRIIFVLRVPAFFIPLSMGMWPIILLLNSVQIFSCYMWICYEGDEDMEKKPKNVERSYEKER